MIGILAGMGPKSTGPFVDKAVEECQKMYRATNDIDFPHMIERDDFPTIAEKARKSSNFTMDTLKLQIK